MRGRDGNIHRGRPREGLPAMISHLGSLISVVCGMLMARRLKGESGIVGATSIGDGGTSTGAFHEAMNLAAVEKLPLVVAVANNQFAYSTPTEHQFACKNLVDRATGYGIHGHLVEGTDLAACLDVFQSAVEAARTTQTPQMVVGKLLRLSGHGEHDDASYVNPSLRKEISGRDPLDVARKQLLESRWATESDLAGWNAEAAEAVSQAFAQVQNEAPPDAHAEDWEALASRQLVEGRAG